MIKTDRHKNSKPGGSLSKKKEPSSSIPSQNTELPESQSAPYKSDPMWVL